MLEKEFEWVVHAVRSLQLAPGSTIANVGSGPLLPESKLHGGALAADLGLDVVNIDFFDGPGVSYTGDLCSVECWKMVARMSPSLVLMTNVLEHLESPDLCLKFMKSEIPSGTFVLVTVPSEYPYHPDPIDNMTRLTGGELVELFSEYSVKQSDTIDGGTMSGRLISDWSLLCRSVVGAPFRRSARERLSYWGRQVRVGAALLEVP